MKQLSDMLQCTADSAMRVNEDGTVILWNEAAERLLGFLAQAVTGRPLLLGGCEPRPGAREES